MLAAQDLDEGLFAVTHTALALLAGDMAGVLLVDGDEVVMRACVGNRQLTTARLRMRRGVGLAGHVFAWVIFLPRPHWVLALLLALFAALAMTRRVLSPGASARRSPR